MSYGKLDIIHRSKGTINNTNVIYFSNDKELTVQNTVEPTYTIADKLNLLSDPKYNKGTFDSTKLKDYKPGDIISYNGFTYMRTSIYDKDRYTRAINNNNIKEVPAEDHMDGYYYFHAGDYDTSVDLYVKRDYITTVKGSKLKNNIINCVVKNNELKVSQNAVLYKNSFWKTLFLIG